MIRYTPSAIAAGESVRRQTGLFHRSIKLGNPLQWIIVIIRGRFYFRSINLKLYCFYSNVEKFSEPSK